MTLFQLLWYTFLRDKLGFEEYVKNIGIKMLYRIEWELELYSWHWQFVRQHNDIEQYKREELIFRKEFIKAFFKID